jgi:glutamate racemase
VRGAVARYLAPLVEARIDTLVLGCTHYPLLRAAIARALPQVTLIDSAEAIAAEVRARVADEDGREGVHAFLVTDTPEKFLAVAGRFLGRAVTSAEHVDV